MDENWNNFQEEVRRHYMRKKLIWAFIIGLFLLALLTVSPAGSPLRPTFDTISAPFQKGWQNLKDAFDPELIAQREEERRLAALVEEEAKAEDDATGTTDAEANSAAEAYPVQSFVVDLPDDATSLTVAISAEPGATLDLSLDGAQLGTGMVSKDGTVDWNLDEAFAADPGAPKGDVGDTVEQTVVVVSPSVIDQIDMSMPLFLAGKTAPSSVVVISVDGDEFERTGADDEGNWEAEISLKSLKPGNHSLTARTLDTEGEPLSNAPEFEFALSDVPAMAQETLFELVVADDELTTLESAIELAGLQNALIDDEELTVFAPTDAAFAALPKPIANAFLSNVIALRELLLHHVVAGEVAKDALTADMQSLGGAMIKLESATGSVQAENGIVYKIDSVLLPPPAISKPLIDSSGVETFTGNFLTVVGSAEPNSNLLLTLNGEKFGEAIVSPDGVWAISGPVNNGDYDILAYSYTDELELAVSDTITLAVEN